MNWSSGFGGAHAISPADASAEEAPRNGDLETAKLLELVSKLSSSQTAERLTSFKMASASPIGAHHVGVEVDDGAPRASAKLPETGKRTGCCRAGIRDPRSLCLHSTTMLASGL